MKTLSIIALTILVLPSIASARFMQSVEKPTRGNYENVFDKKAMRKAQFLTPKEVPEVTWKTACHPTGDYCFEYPDTWEMYINAKQTGVVLNRIARDITDERRGNIYIYK